MNQAHKGIDIKFKLFQPLADYLKSGTPAERQLKLLLTAKNIGHLLGDTIIQKMKDDNGMPIEGNMAYESITFFKAILEVALERTSDPLLRKLIGQLDEAREIALKNASTRVLKDEGQVHHALKALESFIIQKIKALPIGSSLLIPAGWVTGHLAHAILIKCEKVSF